MNQQIFKMYAQMKVPSIILCLALFLACSKGNENISENENPPSLSSDKAIASFNLLDNTDFCEREIFNLINSDDRIIEIEVTHMTNLSSIEPAIEISQGATISPNGAQDFSSSIVYTVTAEDGSTINYEVKVNWGPTEREILEKLHEMNPGNTSGWDMNDPDVSNWTGVYLDDNGAVERLVLQINGMVNFPDELTQLCTLDEFVINGNPLNVIPDIFFELKSITRLSLVNLGLTDIPDGIGKLTNLWSLYVVVNQIETISSEIAKLKNLEYFQLGENQLKTLPPEIGQLDKLKQLSLSTNLLTEIPPEVSQLENLEDLTIGWNNLNTIPATLGGLKKLTRLTLNDNQITTIPKEIGSISTLEQLFLNRNSINDLPIEIGQLSNLGLLEITANPLTSIPNEICEMEVNYGTNIYKNSNVTCE